jgi:hypothetical protein
MEWTLARAKAVEYQVRSERRFEAEPAHPYRVTVEPSDVLAVLNIRRDQEVVVDPAGLGSIERILDSH